MITDEQERALRREHAELIALLRKSQARAWRSVVRDGCAGVVLGALGIATLVLQYPVAGWWSISIFCSGALLGNAYLRGTRQRYHDQVGAFLQHIGDCLLDGNIVALRKMDALGVP